ncbi:hypothetical protein [Shewanella sp. 1180_01]|uniref:hypothetical protein n=1 Tax=Shewanella sp. 1180_01 TaxID=2604451 RepID=UPI004062D851
MATVTVGGMDAAVEPSGMSLWRVTGETMTIHPVHLTTNLSSFGVISFSQMNSSVVVKIATVATVIATFDSCNQEPYTADAAVEPIGLLLVK